MKIDIFNHISPKIYFEKMMEVAPNLADLGKRVREIPVLVDLDERFRVMDQFDDYAQVICLPGPPLEVVGDLEVSPDLAKAANDGMAEYVAKYPDRFPGFIASMPMNNTDEALKEIDRAIKDLKAVGVQFFTNVNGKPLDLPEFKPLFAKMVEYDLPIWIHPIRGANFPDYMTEEKSKYEIWWTFGWPYETSVMMARLVFGYYFDEFPNLKIITHHMGGMVPYFEGRVGPGPADRHGAGRRPPPAPGSALQGGGGHHRPGLCREWPGTSIPGGVHRGTGAREIPASLRGLVAGGDRDRVRRRVPLDVQL